MSNLTEFESGSIRIKLNFSDPIFVSQGYEKDQVRVRLLKSYFTTPSKLKAQGYQSTGRRLAEIDQDEEYIIFTEDIPRQVKNEEELAALENTAQTVETALTTTFVITFIVNLILNGVMTQLWVVFNVM